MCFRLSYIFVILNKLISVCMFVIVTHFLCVTQLECYHSMLSIVGFIYIINVYNYTSRKVLLVSDWTRFWNPD